MTLEQIKKDWISNHGITDEQVDWLIAEVERLEKTQVKGVFQRFTKGRDTEKETATRCAEIAGTYRTQPNQHPLLAGVGIETAIRKEFNLN